MKLWVDEARSAPEGYVWCKSVNEACAEIRFREDLMQTYYNEYHYPYDIALARYGIELIDIGRGRRVYIRLLHWLEETGRNYQIYVHESMN